MMKRAVFSLSLGSLILFFISILPQTSSAMLIDFKQLGGNGSGYYAVLDNNELTIHNDNPGSLLAGFYFYFDDKSLDVSYNGTGFSSPAHPAFLPELYAPPVNADKSFGFNNPSARVGYQGSITFKLDNSLSQASLESLFQDNHILVGLFVQDYMDEQSAKFVSSTSPVPLPASLVLLVSGLTGVAWIRRKIKR